MSSISDFSIAAKLAEAGVTKQARATTLAQICPEARKQVEEWMKTKRFNEGMDLYVRPMLYLRSTAKEINRASLVFDLLYKELLISGAIIGVYPIHEMLKDFKDGANEDSPYSLGNRLEINQIADRQWKLSNVDVIMINDLLPNEKYQVPDWVSGNYLTWMKKCKNKYNISFIFYGLLDIKRSSNVWSPSLASYLQENVIDISVA